MGDGVKEESTASGIRESFGTFLNPRLLSTAILSSPSGSQDLDERSTYQKLSSNVIRQMSRINSATKQYTFRNVSICSKAALSGHTEKGGNHRSRADSLFEGSGPAELVPLPTWRTPFDR